MHGVGSNQNPNKAQILHVADLSLQSLLIYRFPLLFFFFLATYFLDNFGNWIFYPVEFSIF